MKNGIRLVQLRAKKLDDDQYLTLAKKASMNGFEVFMMTPDKDYAQLVEEHVYLYKPAYMGNAVDILGIDEVLKK